jgi:hypothetical protein
MPQNLLVDEPAAEPESMRAASRKLITTTSMLRDVADDLEMAAESEHAIHDDHSAHAEKVRDLAAYANELATQYRHRVNDHPAHEDGSDRLPRVRVEGYDESAGETELELTKREGSGTSWVAALVGSSDDPKYAVEREFVTPKAASRSTARIPDGVPIELAHSKGRDKVHQYYLVSEGELEAIEYDDAIETANSLEWEDD